MKKISIAILTLTVFFVCACRNSNHPAQDTEAPQQEAQNINENSEISIPEVKDGEVNVITEDQFNEWIAELDNPKGFQYRWETPAIVDCYANWCRPCHSINPILVELAKDYKGKVIIYKLNIDKAPRVAEAFGINSIPCLLFFKSNANPTMMIGAHSKDEFSKAINDILLTEE